LGINFKRIGLGLLFVPITTLSLSTLSGKNIGEGAAFTGMMRQLGGSFGIAIITTFITLQSGASCKFSCSDGTKFEVQQRQLLQRIYVKSLHCK
jgi:DHA2 family multidrug resistance protein